MALTVADRLAIREPLARHAHASDGVDAEARSDVFTDDGVFAASGPALRGRAQLLAAQRPANAADLRHRTNSTVIEGDGESARAATYLAVFDAAAGPAEPPRIWLTGVCYDTLRKVGGRWKFACRNLVRDDLRDEQTPGFLL